MDRAILDRFVTIEMDVLDDVKEFGLLKFMFPEVNEDDLKASLKSLTIQELNQ